ncbi:MAG TPA: phosphate ABC transporter permease PtsA [Acidimicrobiaceae bacterium]|nr:phosphate ABC transporter permease PtsA [Acidimicrobiaceae bacterium]HCB37259.1 phosphate ABC transporter permease PtsA [Acidimicrobiaceae bacterium]
MPLLTTPSALSAETADRLRSRHVDVAGMFFKTCLIGATVFAAGFLAVLLGVMIVEGWDVLTTRPLHFLTHGFSQTSAASAGVWHGIVGSLQLALITGVLAVPVGVATAVYLVEYASKSRFSRFVELNIRNLAGVPSIVYGLLGLAIFVKSLGSITHGKTVISGGLTLAALAMPIIVITSVEALKAIPTGIRESAYAVGATKWEVVSRQVLPAGLPTILTGTVLALARAAGEAAPLILVGAATGFFTFGDANVAETFTGPFTALPVLIFNFARQPGREWQANAAAASVVVMLLVLAINGAAIYLRNRFERRW